jgi:NTE family protein
LKIFFSLIFLAILPIFVHGQKVALVLSGGGAKGLAHVSVLKELEKNHIPIDYVVGTSMGAVIGGFYAAGYSPQEIEDIVLSKDFQNWVNGQAGKYYNYHYVSKEPDPTFFTVELDVKQSLSASFRNTIANDAIINFKLTEYLSKASQAADYDFDNLFVPFRAIAAEIFTQEEVVLKDGLLSEAVRASMAVPFFYNPVRVKNDRLLFDGGIYNNFPVDVARKEFNPDVIIGVNVSTPVFKEYPYEEDEKLVNQSLFLYLLNKSNPALLKNEDIYIEPDTKGMSATDFSKVTPLLDSGETTILRKLPEIKEKIERRMDSLSRNNKRDGFVLKEAPVKISSIQFRGFNSKQSKYLSNLFQLRKSSDFDIEDIKKGYYRLAAEDYFNNIFPILQFDKNDSSYIFELRGSSDNSFKIDFGGYITSRNFSELFLGFRFNTLKSNLAEHAVHAYTGRFYQSIHYYSRFNIPGRNLFYIEPEMTYNNWDFIDISDILIKENSQSDFVQQNDLKAGLNVGIPIGTKYRMVFQGFYLNNGDQYSNTQELQSTDTLDQLKFDGVRTGVVLSKNSLNKILYPNEGERFEVKAAVYYGQERYTPGTTSLQSVTNQVDHSWITLGLGWEKYVPVGRKFFAGWQVESVFSNQPFFSNYQGTVLNAPVFNPLNDSKTRIIAELRAFKYVAGGVKGIYKPTKRLDFRLEGYTFAPVSTLFEEAPQVPGEILLDGTLHFAGTLNGVYHSPIGPVSIALNYYEPLRNHWSVMFHAGFLLFNKRSFE